MLSLLSDWKHKQQHTPSERTVWLSVSAFCRKSITQQLWAVHKMIPLILTSSKCWDKKIRAQLVECSLGDDGYTLIHAGESLHVINRYSSDVPEQQIVWIFFRDCYLSKGQRGETPGCLSHSKRKSTPGVSLPKGLERYVWCKQRHSIEPVWRNKVLLPNSLWNTERALHVLDLRTPSEVLNHLKRFILSGDADDWVENKHSHEDGEL